jgi:hypothetical protein
MKRALTYFCCTCFAALTGCDFSNPWDYSSPATISHSITGGIAGIHEETVINENGLAKLTHHYSHQKYVVHDQLTSSQLDSLKDAFDRADFLTLRDRYEPKQIIMDGFLSSTTYSSDDGCKTVAVESGADLPKGLSGLLEQLYRTNEIILQNPDAGTLLIGSTFTIKVWPFSENIKLADHIDQDIHLNNAALYRDIFNLLDQIGGDIHQTVLWEGDHLYRITFWRNGLTFEENIGSYFRVWDVPLRYWPAEFGFSLRDIPPTGQIVSAAAHRDVRQFLNENTYYLQLFIFDELKDDGQAVWVTLLSGKPE